MESKRRGRERRAVPRPTPTGCLETVSCLVWRLCGAKALLGLLQALSEIHAGKLDRLAVYLLMFCHGGNAAENRHGTCIQACCRVAHHLWATETEGAAARRSERFHIVSGRSHSPIGEERSGDGVEPCQGRRNASSVDERCYRSVGRNGVCGGNCRPKRRAKDVDVADQSLQEADRERARRSSGLAGASDPAETLSARTEEAVFSHTPACAAH